LEGRIGDIDLFQRKCGGLLSRLGSSASGVPSCREREFGSFKSWLAILLNGLVEKAWGLICDQ
jgi:hypothetical protein